MDLPEELGELLKDKRKVAEIRKLAQENPQMVKEAMKFLAQNKPKKEKIGRNEKCPCNSGKKYKKCCLNKTDE